MERIGKILEKRSEADHLNISGYDDVRSDHNVHFCPDTDINVSMKLLKKEAVEGNIGSLVIRVAHPFSLFQRIWSW